MMSLQVFIIIKYQRAALIGKVFNFKIQAYVEKSFLRSLSRFMLIL